MIGWKQYDRQKRDTLLWLSVLIIDGIISPWRSLNDSVDIKAVQSSENAFFENIFVTRLIHEKPIRNCFPSQSDSLFLFISVRWSYDSIERPNILPVSVLA